MAGFTNGNWDASNPYDLPDVAAVKLSGEKEELWRYQRVATESSTETYFDVNYVTAVTVDAEGDPILVGSTFSSIALEEGERDYFAMKVHTSPQKCFCGKMNHLTVAFKGAGQNHRNRDAECLPHPRYTCQRRLLTGDVPIYNFAFRFPLASSTGRQAMRFGGVRPETRLLEQVLEVHRYGTASEGLDF